MPTARPTKPAATKPSRSRLAFLRGRRWKLYAALAVGIPLVVASVAVTYYYISFSRIIDARMHGEFLRTEPRIFARPLTVRRGQRVTMPQMIDRLNDLGYAQRPAVEQPGEFAIGQNTLAIVPRSGDRTGETLRFTFAAPDKKGTPGPLQTIESVTKKQNRRGRRDGRAAADRARSAKDARSAATSRSRRFRRA